MIYVRVELWPHGDRGRARTLAEMTVTNDGTGTRESGNYRVRATLASRPRESVVGRVRAFPRRLNVWFLIDRAVAGLVRPVGRAGTTPGLRIFDWFREDPDADGGPER